MGADIEIGRTGAGAPVLIDLEELLATRLLVQGNSGSGKSHLLRRLLEQSAGLVQQIVIDPEGDFTSFGEHVGHLVLDASECQSELGRIGERVRRHRVSAVLNLEGLEVDDQLRAAATFLNALFDVDRDIWFPVLVIARDAVILLGCGVLFHMDEKLIVSPSWSGKAATAFQMLAIAWMMLQLPHYLVSVYVAGIFTLISGATYVARGIAQLRHFDKT